MRFGRPSLASLASVLLVLFGTAAAAAADKPPTGPTTEERFPPLVLPPGFKATLFACDPLVEYPSVIALGPRKGTVFVAHDYLTGLGTEITRRDEVRLLEDTDGDGYADRSTLFAEGLNSVQGLAFDGATVYAMHAPLLTALADADGDGRADLRRDLVDGLGLTPEDNATRLHSANGVAVGHDGWLYLAVGDHGVTVTRPEGDRLELKGGGILRCRPDGRGLHVFASGLRNIYDVALDADLSVFVRDNENDGGDYLIRVCHSFFGADHGYPYLYRDRPDEALATLADLGRGSSAGGAAYLETALPPEYRGALLFCEWGRALVWHGLAPAPGGFALTDQADFAAAADTDPYGFKPTDVVVDYDGSILVSDWGDGQRPVRGRGRVYRIVGASEPQSERAPLATQPADAESWVVGLDAPGYHARVAAQTALVRLGDAGLAAVRDGMKRGRLGVLGRMHAVWIISRTPADALPELFALAERDPEPRVRVQAVRAIADRTDPNLADHDTSSLRGDEFVARRLASLAVGADQTVFHEVVVALGRLRWVGAPEWLRDHLAESPAPLAHAAMQALRRAENWPAVLGLLDLDDGHSVRPIAVRALADQGKAEVVDGLLDRIPREPRAARRQQFADLLTRVYKLPGESDYWGYRPAPRPANTVTWERSEAIAAALDGLLSDPDPEVRVAVLRRMQREAVPLTLDTLGRWLTEERRAESVAAILESLATIPADNTRDLLTAIVDQRQYAPANRLAALEMLLAAQPSAEAGPILAWADRIEDGPVLVRLIGELVQRPDAAAAPLLLGKLDSGEPSVRAAALAACSALKLAGASDRVATLLRDPDPGVRLAAAAAVGALDAKDAAAPLAAMIAEGGPELQGTCLDSLRALGEPQAVAAAVAALDHAASQRAAVDYLAEFGTPENAGLLTGAAARNRSIEIVGGAVRGLTRYEGQAATGSQVWQELRAAAAQVQGESGIVLRWQVIGPVAAQAAADMLAQGVTSEGFTEGPWRLATGADGRLELPPEEAGPGMVWLAASQVSLPAATPAQFLAGSDGPMELFVNGASVYRRSEPRPFQPDSDRFQAELAAGVNRLAIQVAAEGRPAALHLRFRRLSSSAEHERLAQFALINTGDAARGRELFQNADKSLCVKCHTLGQQGGKIGPNLTGVGGRISRVHLIESILEPGRTIAPSYETTSVVLADGRVLIGMKVAEDATTLTLGDETGKLHVVPIAEIEERAIQRRSTMPDGLEKRFTDGEFLDLLAFLLAERQSGAP
jgi:putative membrane-bound dehydrogenase-like protein